jgi:hypothetical protein
MVTAMGEFLKTDEAKKRGFLHVTDIATAAVRELLDKYGNLILKPRFVHFNVYEDHVTLMDNELNRLVDVFFQHDKAYCEECQAHECDHTQFALRLPKVVSALAEKGWVIEDGKIIKGPI